MKNLTVQNSANCSKQCHGTFQAVPRVPSGATDILQRSKMSISLHRGWHQISGNRGQSGEKPKQQKQIG